ncbi:MAG: DNA gyrase subunit A, partial [Micrococcales bacterium]|nr:DNA gyrase subunit A [Micrococcales bacterium]
EDNFGINNVTLVDGQPRTLGLRELLRVYVEFRLSVVRRRSQFRLRKREERLHLVEGLLIAILDIDEVIALIRSSDDTAQARTRLIDVFDLDEVQANYILELQLRRLTKFSRIELETEKVELQAQIAQLGELLGDEGLLRTLVRDELQQVSEKLGTPRRTVLLEGSAVASGPTSAATPLEVGDDACWVLLSSTGLLARTSDATPPSARGRRAKHDAIVAVVPATARGEVGLVTTGGRIVRVSVLELPALPPVHGAPNLSGGAPFSSFVELPAADTALTIMSLGSEGTGLALGTAHGVVKRVSTDYPAGRDEWEAISLKPGDRVVGAAELTSGLEELVFVTSDAQLLHFGADKVRPQGRAAGGMVGIKLAPKASAIWFGAVDATGDNVVVTIAGSGRTGTSIKVTPFAEYPGKGRATGGVRCHRFLHDEDALVLGWVGPAPRAAASTGVARLLPEASSRRDGSGAPLEAPIAAVAPGAHPALGRSSSVAGSAGGGDEADAQPGPAAQATERARSGLASDPGSLFDLPAPQAPRPRPRAERDDYDPDSLDDVVQTGDE